MSRTRLLVILGILIVLSPFFGLPYSYLLWLLPVLGVLVIAVSVAFPRRKREQSVAHDESAPL